MIRMTNQIYHHHHHYRDLIEAAYNNTKQQWAMAQNCHVKLKTITHVLHGDVKMADHYQAALVHPAVIWYAKHNRNRFSFEIFSTCPN